MYNGTKTRDRLEFYPGYGLIPLGSPLSDLYTYENDCAPSNAKGWGCTYYVIHSKNIRYLRLKK